MSTCLVCGKPIEQVRRSGRRREFCGAACRQKAYRRRTRGEVRSAAPLEGERGAAADAKRVTELEREVNQLRAENKRLRQEVETLETGLEAVIGLLD